MMNAVEYCKQHDGTVTVKDIEAMKSFSECENIRLKHKVG